MKSNYFPVLAVAVKQKSFSTMMEMGMNIPLWNARSVAFKPLVSIHIPESPMVGKRQRHVGINEYYHKEVKCEKES